MASQRRTTTKDSTPRRRPATTPEDREKELVALAVDLAEKQLRDGTASAQVITHYLRHGSPREQAEREKIREEILLRKAQREQMASAAKVEELYGAAISAMRAYAGEKPLDTDDEFD